MDTRAALNRAVWDIEQEFNRMFLVFPAGRYFCYRTEDDVYFLLDLHPDRLSVILRFALNLSFAEERMFDKIVEIDAAGSDKEELLRRIVVAILAYTDEFPIRPLRKPIHSIYS